MITRIHITDKVHIFTIGSHRCFTVIYSGSEANKKLVNKSRKRYNMKVQSHLSNQGV